VFADLRGQLELVLKIFGTPLVTRSILTVKGYVAVVWPLAELNRIIAGMAQGPSERYDDRCMPSGSVVMQMPRRSDACRVRLEEAAGHAPSPFNLNGVPESVLYSLSSQRWQAAHESSCRVQDFELTEIRMFRAIIIEHGAVGGICGEMFVHRDRSALLMAGTHANRGLRDEEKSLAGFVCDCFAVAGVTLSKTKRKRAAKGGDHPERPA